MSSESLERAAQTIRGAFWHGQGLGGHNNYRAAEDALAALLAEVARLGQEHERPDWCVNERCPWPRCDCLPPHVANALEAVEAALAVAREREQRLRGEIRRFIATEYPDGTEHPADSAAHRLARAALVDEPAAATRQPHQALGRCRCGACHTLADAIELNYAAATLAEPDQWTEDPNGGTALLDSPGSASVDTETERFLRWQRGSASAAADEPGETP